ncbi:MAG: arginase family protein [Myxococcota bacterium]
MRVVPVLFPCDLGHHNRGEYKTGGERGAPDVLLDLLEGEGVRLARPRAVPVEVPPEPDDPDAILKFDALLTKALHALAEVVASVNSDADFPLVLGGDHTTMCGHVLGHSERHEAGIGLAVLADARADLASPAPPVYDDAVRLRKDAEVTRDGGASRMALSGALRLLDDQTAFGRAMKASAVQSQYTSVVGVRARPWAQMKPQEKRAKIDIWTMERLEFDGESTYRSMLTRHLSAGPIVLSIDVGGLDPDLMHAIREPVIDGLDWSFLKRTLEQCVPHVDRILGLDICEVDPSREAGHRQSLTRFAETIAPFLKRLTR